MAEAKHSTQLDIAILARLLEGFRDGLTNAVIAIQASNLVPLWYVPLLFCGVPGNPNLLPEDKQCLVRCLVRWAKLMARAIACDELSAREPNGWSILAQDETVTADCLVYMGDLDQWAGARHGLSIFPEKVPGKPLEDRPSLNIPAVTLPHMTKDLEKVFQIMRDQWSNIDPDRLPKQTNIARDIDEALGWKADRYGTPSRNARAIAALIKPDDVKA